MRSIRMLGLALVATMAVAGCGGDDDDNPFGPGNMGTFTGTIAGDVSASLSGNAFFSVIDDPSGDYFDLTLTSGPALDPTHILGLIRLGGRPGNGTYQIGDLAANFSGGLIDGAGMPWDITSGSITITSSGVGGVGGTISLTATDGTNDITITGSFSAECLEDTADGYTCG